MPLEACPDRVGIVFTLAVGWPPRLLRAGCATGSMTRRIGGAIGHSSPRSESASTSSCWPGVTCAESARTPAALRLSRGSVLPCLTSPLPTLVSRSFAAARNPSPRQRPTSDALLGTTGPCLSSSMTPQSMPPPDSTPFGGSSCLRRRPSLHGLPSPLFAPSLTPPSRLSPRTLALKLMPRWHFSFCLSPRVSWPA